jgi:hypothetical protein
VTALLVVALSSGGGHTLSLREAAAPTLLAATAPAPHQSDHSRFVGVQVEGVRFPYWGDAFGWHSSGSRADTVDGRSVTTVFYTRGASHIGYAIYSGVRSPASSGGVVRHERGTEYRVEARGGEAIIAWTRGGHLCVMSSRSASAAELIRLAGWGETGTAV